MLEILFVAFIAFIIFLVLVDKDWKFDMICAIVVVRNNFKPFKPASLPIKLGVRQGFWVKWLFCCLFASALHARAERLHGRLGRKHRAAHHPVDNPTELYARYRARQRDKVRQDLYRMNRILMGKLVHTHGLGGGLLTLGETMSKRMLTIEKEKPINKYNG